MDITQIIEDIKNGKRAKWWWKAFQTLQPEKEKSMGWTDSIWYEVIKQIWEIEWADKVLITQIS